MEIKPTVARRVGLNDVARLAGVSHQTVSRVVNGHPSVRPETRARVQAAIAQLQYRRNNTARALVTNRSGLLGVVTVGSLLFGPSVTMAAIEEAARARGYLSLVSTLRQPDPAALHEAIESCLAQGVEALIVVASRQSLVHPVTDLALPVPVFVVGSALPRGRHERTFAVGIDQVLGGRLAAQHLLDLGHTDVLHVAGPLEWVDAQQRITGWQAVCDERDVDGSRLHVGDWTPESGYQIGRRLAGSGQLPTGIFAANDHMALGLLNAFQEAGVRLGEDVSVVGFDDIVGADHFNPPLTTVRQDFTALGHHVLEAALAVLEGREPGLGPIVPTLVDRRTTGRAPR